MSGDWSSDVCSSDLPETIREWKTLRRNLAFANAALSIGNAEQFVDSDRRSTDDTVPA